jgi:hypothetical protein
VASSRSTRSRKACAALVLCPQLARGRLLVERPATGKRDRGALECATADGPHPKGRLGGARILGETQVAALPRDLDGLLALHGEPLVQPHDLLDLLDVLVGDADGVSPGQDAAALLARAEQPIEGLPRHPGLVAQEPDLRRVALAGRGLLHRRPCRRDAELTGLLLYGLETLALLQSVALDQRLALDVPEPGHVGDDALCLAGSPRGPQLLLGLEVEGRENLQLEDPLALPQLELTSGDDLLFDRPVVARPEPLCHPTGD